MTWDFVRSHAMSDRPPTRFLTDCRTEARDAAGVHLEIGDGVIELRTPAGGSVMLTAEQAGELRSQLGAALTFVLMEARVRR